MYWFHHCNVLFSGLIVFFFFNFTFRELWMSFQPTFLTVRSLTWQFVFLGSVGMKWNKHTNKPCRESRTVHVATQCCSLAAVPRGRQEPKWSRDVAVTSSNRVGGGRRGNQQFPTDRFFFSILFYLSFSSSSIRPSVRPSASLSAPPQSEKG